MPDASVVVIHPGTQHSYEAAFALQDSGLLGAYLTGLYFKRSGSSYKFGRLLPAKARVRFDAQLAKRRKAGLCDELVRTHSLIEGAFVASRHFATPGWLADYAFHLRNRIFHRLVAKHVEATAPAALICYDSCGPDCFQAAQRVGTIKVLDQTCPHVTTAAQIMELENSRTPLDLRMKIPPKWRQDLYTEEAKMADLILAGSAFVRESLVKLGIAQNKIVVLPYGVDLDLFSPATETRSDGKVIMMFTGQLSPRKGITYLLEAFQGLDNLNCKLLLVGGGSKDKRLLEGYGVAFEHIPFVPRMELASHYRRADCFVFPSLLEGSALVTYEALASGLPVITTPNSGSIVRDGIEGLIVPARDVAALRESIQKLAVDAELRRVMGRAARRRAEEYSWGKYHHRLTEIIRNELERRKLVTSLEKKATRSFAERAQ